VHYNDNGFLVRPAPMRWHLEAAWVNAIISAVAATDSSAALISTHQFYEVVWAASGYNGLAGRLRDLNAQMAAGDLPIDTTGALARRSFFYAAATPTDRRQGHRFSSTILDKPELFHAADLVQASGRGGFLISAGTMINFEKRQHRVGRLCAAVKTRGAGELRDPARHFRALVRF